MSIDESAKKKQTPKEINVMMKLTMAKLKKERLNENS
jgi:hypothetical protein